MILAFIATLRENGHPVLDPPSGDILSAILSAGSFEQDELLAELETWFLAERLRVPGPPLSFNSEAALWGARWFFRAACFHTFRDIVEDEVRKGLDECPQPDLSLSETHLSADLLLQHLPSLYTQAKNLAFDDILTQRIESLAQQLPLSGVGIKRTIPADHPIFHHEGLTQYLVERALRIPCRSTFESPYLREFATSRLGDYADDLSQGVLRPNQPIEATN